MTQNSPSAFTTSLGGGRSLNVAISPSSKGLIIHAEEWLNGRMVGEIHASQTAIQRTLGIAQRIHQGQLAERDRPAAESFQRQAADILMASMVSRSPRSRDDRP